MQPLSPKTERLMLWIVTAGMLLIVIGTMLPLLSGLTRLSAVIGSGWFRYIYAAGAVITLVGRMFTPYRGDNLRLKRLYRIEAWSGIFFCVGAFFLFYDTTSLRDWLAFTLAGRLYPGLCLIHDSAHCGQIDRRIAQKAPLTP